MISGVPCLPLWASMRLLCQLPFSGSFLINPLQTSLGGGGAIWIAMPVSMLAQGGKHGTQFLYRLIQTCHPVVKTRRHPDL